MKSLPLLAILVALLVITPGMYIVHNSEMGLVQSSIKPSRSGISIDGDFRDWHQDDCRYVDAVGNDTYILGDGRDNSRDLMAFYMHMDDARVYLRVDLYDLAYGAENGNLDIYFAFDLCPGGSEELPDDLATVWSEKWDLVVAIYDSEHYSLITPQGALDGSVDMAYNSRWDSVEISVARDVFTSAGYSGGDMHLAVYTAKDFSGRITDTIPNDFPWEDGRIDGYVSSSSIASSVDFAFFHHGNQFLKNISGFIKDSNGMGFWQVPRIHEYWGVPVNLHVSGTLAEAIQWYAPWFNRYLRELHDRGLVYFVGGFYSEYIPLYLPEEFNLWSMSYARKQIMEYYNATTDVCWMPERVYWDGWESLVAHGNYSIVMVDTEDGFRWYVHDGDPYAVYTTENGVRVLFISNEGYGGAPHNVQDQVHNNYDGGMSLSLRELAVSLALEGNRYMLYMDDWEKTCGNIPLWGGPEAVEAYNNTVGWVAQHQWIHVSTLPEVASLPSHGKVDINDCTYFWIRQKMGTLGDPQVAPYDNHCLYDAWYYDPAGDIPDIEYFNYTPPGCSMPMGDYHSNGTIIHDTWELIRTIKHTPVRELAFKTFATMMYETAWMENVWAHNNALELAYWEKEQAAHVRTSAIYHYYDIWLSQRYSGIRAVDVDLDGQNEYIMTSPAVFLVFEARGGKLVFAGNNLGRVLIGNTLTGYMDERDAWTDAITSTTTNSHYSGESLGNAEQAGAFYLQGSKVYAFETPGLENEIFSAEISNNTLIFSHDDEVKTFVLNASTLICTHTPEYGLRLTASPDLLNISVNGDSIIVVGGNISSPGGFVDYSFDSPIVERGSVIMAKYITTAQVESVKATFSSLPVGITDMTNTSGGNTTSGENGTGNASEGNATGNNTTPTPVEGNTTTGENGTSGENNTPGGDTTPQTMAEVILLSPTIYNPPEANITWKIISDDMPDVSVEVDNTTVPYRLWNAGGVWYLNIRLNSTDVLHVELAVNGNRSEYTFIPQTGSKEKQTDSRGEICLSVILMYVLPLLGIIFLGMGIEEIYNRKFRGGRQ